MYRKGKSEAKGGGERVKRIMIYQEKKNKWNEKANYGFAWESFSSKKNAINWFLGDLKSRRLVNEDYGILALCKVDRIFKDEFGKKVKE